MSKEDKDEIINIIKLNLQGDHARNKADHEMIEMKLDNIKDQLELMVDHYLKHDKIINDALAERERAREHRDNFEATRGDTCPKKEEIDKIKDDLIEISTVKKLIIKTIAISVSIVALIAGIIKLITIL